MQRSNISAFVIAMELQQEVLKLTHCCFNSLHNLHVINAEEQGSVVIAL